LNTSAGDLLGSTIWRHRRTFVCSLLTSPVPISRIWPAQSTAHFYSRRWILAWPKATFGAASVELAFSSQLAKSHEGGGRSAIGIDEIPRSSDPSRSRPSHHVFNAKTSAAPSAIWIASSTYGLGTKPPPDWFDGDGMLGFGLQLSRLCETRSSSGAKLRAMYMFKVGAER